MHNSTSIRLGQESFEIYADEDDESSIFGTIQGTTSTGSIHFIGQEKIGDQISYLMNEVYSFSETESQEVPFEFVLPRDLPPSIQLENGDGVSYYVQVHTDGQIMATEPVCLYSNMMCDHDDKVFWGIIQNQWQYEIEFPSVYYFNKQDSNTSQVCIRFKSLEGQQKKLSDCCLVGFQLIQSIQREGCEVEYQVITMDTRLLTDLNQTWNDPYLLTFELPVSGETRLLPTTWTGRIEIQHDIKFTLAFTDPINNLNFDLPVTCIEDSPISHSINSSSNSSIVTTLDAPRSDFKAQDPTIFINSSSSNVA